MRRSKPQERPITSRKIRLVKFIVTRRIENKRPKIAAIIRHPKASETARTLVGAGIEGALSISQFQPHTSTTSILEIVGNSDQRIKSMMARPGEAGELARSLVMAGVRETMEMRVEKYVALRQAS